MSSKEAFILGFLIGVFLLGPALSDLHEYYFIIQR